MGNRQVGKTSVINAFIANQSQRGTAVKSTNVMQDFTKVLQVNDSDGKQHELTLNIWDAAGD